MQRLLWIPALGKVNAFTLYTEIDGITRFPSAPQFFSSCRLVPGAANSGGRTRHRSGSKAGNRYLKLAFSHAGIRAAQYNPEIRVFFNAKRRKKPIKVARSTRYQRQAPLQGRTTGIRGTARTTRRAPLAAGIQFALLTAHFLMGLGGSCTPRLRVLAL